MSLDSIRSSLARCSETWYIYYPAVVLIISLSVLLITLAVNNAQTVLDRITWNADDSLIPDFTEVVWKAYKGNPYDMGSTYLPITFLIFKLFSYLIPDISSMESYSLTPLDPNIPYFLAEFGIMMGLCIVVTILILYKEVKERRILSILILLLLLGTPMIWMIERGNIIFLGFTFLLYFYFNYDSDTAWKKKAAVFYLIMACSIKPYLGVLIILLLKDKMYKEIIQAILGLLIINLIASLWFGGAEVIGQIISNMTNLNLTFTFIDGFKIGAANTLEIIFSNMGIEINQAADFMKYFICIGLLVYSILSRYRSLCALSAILCYIMFSNVSWTYLLILLIIPIAAIYLENISEEFAKPMLILLIFSIAILPVGVYITPSYNTVPITYFVDALVVLGISLVFAAIGFKRALEFVLNRLTSPEADKKAQ